MSDLFVRERPIKKHTRTIKETLIIYAIGTFLCVYIGFLLGAVWIDGNNLNEFLDNFQSFIIDQHHFIVGVTPATPKFVLTFVVGWSMAYIIICTKIEHPFAGEEFGKARWQITG